MRIDSIIIYFSFITLDGQLAKERKREMLQDLNVLIKAGSHQNIISLIGTHETSDILYIVLEIEQNSLKNILLESRKIDQSTTHRFCTLPETFIINTYIGIVQGMEYLNKKKVYFYNYLYFLFYRETIIILKKNNQFL